MRFHIGLSLNWKRLKKWLITILLGLLLYLGFNCIQVHAASSYEQIFSTDEYGTLVTLDGLMTYDISQGSKFTYYQFKFTNTDLEKGKTYHVVISLYGTLGDGYYSFDPDVWEFSSYDSVNNKVDNLNTYNLKMTGTGEYRTIEFDFYNATDYRIYRLSSANSSGMLYYQYSGSGSFGWYSFDIQKINDSDDVIINQNDQIINEQEKTNEKLDELNENQKVCSFIDKKNISLNNKYLGSNGVVNDSTSGNGITDYISLSGSTIIVKSTTNRDHNYCFYDANKSVISCHYSDTLVLDSTLSIPKNASYVRFTINTNENKPTFEICKNGNQAITDSQEEIKDAITDSTVDKDSGNSFFDNFSTEDNGGISGIITAPLTLINSLLDNQGTCTDLEFPILGKDVAIPSGCMLWDEVSSEMETIIQMLVCGTGAYFILTQLFKDINDLKDPNKQGVSTLDL